MASVGLLCVIQTSGDAPDHGCGLDNTVCPGGTWYEQRRRRRRSPPAACGCHAGGATDWCGTDDSQLPHSEFEGDVHYAYDLPGLCDWGAQPNKVEGRWIQWGFLDQFSSIEITTMSESDLTEEQTTTVGQTVTQSMSAGFGVDVEGISGNMNMNNEISQSWSQTYRTEFTTKSSETTKVTVTSEDAQLAKDEGQAFLWTWQFTTTYNWNGIQVITNTNTRAYTENQAHPPKCVALGGDDDSYQSCGDGTWLPGFEPSSGPGFELSSGNATVI